MIGNGIPGDLNDSDDRGTPQAGLQSTTVYSNRRTVSTYLITPISPMPRKRLLDISWEIPYKVIEPRWGNRETRFPCFSFFTAGASLQVLLQPLLPATIMAV